MNQPVLKFTYLLLLPDMEQPRVIPEKDLQIYAGNVESGDAQILRILAFSEQAKQMSGREIRLEIMQAEEGEEGEESDEGAEYEISWNEIKT